MITVLLTPETPTFGNDNPRNYDPPQAVAIAKPEPPRSDELDLTCLALIRRKKKGKTVSMRLLVRSYASE